MDINEILLTAMDTLVSKRLQSINYDSTDVYTITNADNADKGKYTVSNGAIAFIAYSSDTSYKQNDVVYVTVPNNDFNQQKIIVGKQVSDETTPFVFTTPFDTLLDVSTNLITTTVNEAGLVANEPISDDNPNATEILLWEKDYSNSELAGFTRLGIQARFKTWLDEFDTVEGDYGLKLVVKCEKDNQASTNLVYKKVYGLLDANTMTEDIWDWIKTSSKLSWEDCPTFNDLSWSDYDLKTLHEQLAIINTVKIYVQDKILETCEKYEFIFSSKDMYGNPYNFETFYQQQLVFDITDIGKILEMSLSFYQVPYDDSDENNILGFLDRYGQEVPHTGDFGETLLPNIFVKEPYVCVGYDLSQFDQEQAILYSLKSTTYRGDDTLTDSELHKTVYLRWLHDFGDGKGILPVDEDTNLDYSIYWYQYSLGAGAPDGYAGVNWKKVNQTEKETITFENISTRPSIAFFGHPKYISSTGGFNTYVDEFEIENYKTYLSDAQQEDFAEVADPISGAKNTNPILFNNSIDCSWTDFYNYSFLQDINTNNLYYLGFWEKVTTAFRLYWLYPKEFKKMGCSTIWETGGEYTSLEDLFPRQETAYAEYDDHSDRWASWKGLRLYDVTTIDEFNQTIYHPAQLRYDGISVVTDDEEGAVFTLGDNGLGNSALVEILRAFTDSFGKWILIEDDYGLKNFVPEDEDTLSLLQQETYKLFQCLENPVIETYIDQEFQYTFIPDVTEQYEQIKAIVLYNNEPIYSNVLTFTNEKLVSNAATVDKTNALGLWCVDDTYGNYFVYELGGSIIDTDQSKQIRDLECRFESGIYDSGGVLTEATYIEWRVPYRYTMIYLDFSDNAITKIDYVNPSNNYLYRSYLELEAEEQNKDKIINEGGTLTPEQLRTGWHPHSYTLSGDTTYGGLWSYPMYDEDTDEIVIIWKGDVNNANRINPYLEYSIKSYYSQQYTNNTISCKIEKDTVEYAAAKEMTFGPAGSSGTDATLVLDFEKNEQALTVFNTQDEYDAASDYDHPGITIIAKLYDSSNKEVDIYDVTDGTYKWTWEWLSRVDSNNTIKNPANIKIARAVVSDTDRQSSDGFMTIKNSKYESTTYTNQAPNRVALSGIENLVNDKYTNIDCMNTLLYLKVTLSKWGGYDLSAILPIPLRRYCSDRKYNHITGATVVSYPTNGYATYYPNAYQMHMESGDVGSGHWYIYNPYGETAAYIGNIREEDDIPDDILHPAAVYIPEAEQYGVQYKEDDITYWTQPIYTHQNQYGSSTINKWDGESIDIDYDAGTIVSRGIAAGKKNDENQFSGVMLGDWSTTDTTSEISNCTGIFGFNNGAMSYAITDDGKAFFGKSGKGRILLDGDNSTITSINFDKLNGAGVKLDLDNSYYLQIRGYPYDKPLNTINQNKAYYIMQIGDGKYSNYIQSANYEYIDSQGKQYGLKIDLNDGSLDAKGDFSLTAGDDQIRLSTKSPYLYIRDKHNEVVTCDLLYMADEKYFLQSCKYTDAYTPLESAMDGGQGYLRLDLKHGYIHSSAGMIAGWLMYKGNNDPTQLLNLFPTTISAKYNILMASGIGVVDQSTYYTSLDPSRRMIISAGCSDSTNLEKGSFRVDNEGDMYCRVGYLGVPNNYDCKDSESGAYKLPVKTIDGVLKGCGWIIEERTLQSVAGQCVSTASGTESSTSSDEDGTVSDKGNVSTLSGDIDDNNSYEFSLNQDLTENYSFKLSVDNFERSLCDDLYTPTRLRLAIGNVFGVTALGYLYCNNLRMGKGSIQLGNWYIGQSIIRNKKQTTYWRSNGNAKFKGLTANGLLQAKKGLVVTGNLKASKFIGGSFSGSSMYLSGKLEAGSAKINGAVTCTSLTADGTVYATRGSFSSYVTIAGEHITTGRIANWDAAYSKMHDAVT